MGNELFSSLASQNNLRVLSDMSAEGLWKQIVTITLPVTIIQIYGLNGRHYAWIYTEARARRVATVNPKPKKGESYGA